MYKYRFLRQGITLTGLQTPTFTKAAEAIRDIHSHFDRQFQEGALEEHAKDQQETEELDRIDMWNRYFTPAREAKEMRAMPFLPGVDTQGTLRSMAQEDSNCTYIHTEDNQVQYYMMRRETAGGIRCSLSTPEEGTIALTGESQVRAMRTTSVSSRRFGRGTGFLCRDTSQGRSAQDVDGAAINCVDQRKVQKSKCKKRQVKHATNTRRNRLNRRPKP